MVSEQNSIKIKYSIGRFMLILELFMPGINKYDHLLAIILERGVLLNNLVTVKT